MQQPLNTTKDLFVIFAVILLITAPLPFEEGVIATHALRWATH